MAKKNRTQGAVESAMSSAGVFIHRQRVNNRMGIAALNPSL